MLGSALSFNPSFCSNSGLVKKVVYSAGCVEAATKSTLFNGRQRRKLPAISTWLTAGWASAVRNFTGPFHPLHPEEATLVFPYKLKSGGDLCLRFGAKPRDSKQLVFAAGRFQPFQAGDLQGRSEDRYFFGSEPGYA